MENSATAFHSRKTIAYRPLQLIQPDRSDGDLVDNLTYSIDEKKLYLTSL